MKKILLFLMSSLLGVSLTVSFPQNVSAEDVCTTVAECNEKQTAIDNEKNKRQETIKENQALAQNLNVQIAVLNQEVKMLETEIKMLETNIRLMQEQIERLEANIREKEKQILDRMGTQQKLKYQNSAYLSILNADSIPTLLKRWQAFKVYNDADQALADELAKDKEELEALKLEQEAKNRNLKEKKLQSELKKKELEVKVAEAKKIIEKEEAELEKLKTTEEEIAAQKEILNRPPVVTIPPSGIVPSNGQWHLPVLNGFVSTIFNSSIYQQQFGRDHPAIDVAAANGEPLYAVAAGRVIVATRDGVFGNYVVIAHNIEGVPYISLYAHMSSISVSQGAAVSGGTRIGAVGNTGLSYGAHLHLEINQGRNYFTYDKDVRRRDAVDPLSFLPYQGTWYINEYV